MGPPSKDEMLNTLDLGFLREAIDKYWDKVLAAPPDCSACEAKVADLTKRLKESKDSESKLQAEVEDCKRKLNQPNKDPLQETKDPPPCKECKECKQKLTDCELKLKEIQLKLEECEKRPPRVEYRYIYTPYFVTSIVTQFVPKLVFVTKIIERTKIKEVFKYITKFKIKREYITQYRDRIVNRVVHVPITWICNRGWVRVYG